MYRYIASLFLATILLASCSRSSSDRFIDHYKDKTSAVCMSVPGWLIHTGAKFADDFSSDDDERTFREIASHINGVRFMVLNNNNVITSEDITKLIVDLQEKDGLEVYAVAKDRGTRINVMVKDKSSTIKNMTIIVQAENSFALAKIDTHLPLDVLKNAKFSFNEPSNQVVD